MGRLPTTALAAMAATLLGLHAIAAPAAQFGPPTAAEVEQGFFCAQHGFCTSCLEASSWYSSCTWCPKDHKCHGIGGSLFSACGKSDVVQNTSSCPPPSPPRTAFNLKVAYDMAQYSNAAYYDSPTSQVTPPGFRLRSTFNYTLGTWSTAFGFLGTDKQKQRVVLAFRGSDTLTQVTMECLERKLVDYPGQPGAKVHEYFFEAGVGLMRYVGPHVQELVGECPGCEIHITGHSLGGAMAVLAGVVLQKTHIDRKVVVYTFGQPRVGNYILSEYIDTRLLQYYRITNAADIIPHIPSCVGDIPRPLATCLREPLNYYHAGMEIWFPYGDYKDGFMCGYRECVFDPSHEDMACSNGLLEGGFAGSISDHHGYWKVLPPSGFCGVSPEATGSGSAGASNAKAVAADTVVV